MKILTIAGKNLRIFFRDRAAVFWAFALPIMLIVIFGLAFGAQAEQAEIKVGVVQLDNGQAADVYVQALDNMFDLTKIDDTATAETKVRDGAIVAAIIIPHDFSENLQAGATKISLIYDETKETTARSVIGIVEAINQKFAGQPLVISLDGRTVGGRRWDPFQQYVPAFGTMFMMGMGGMFLASAVIIERKTGTLKRNLLAPVSKARLMSGWLLSALVVGCMQFALFFGIGILGFGMHVEGSLLLMALVGIVVVFFAISLGFLIAGVVRSPDAASGGIWGIIMPMAALGGLWWPVEIMPQFMQNIARVLPTYHAQKAYLDVIVRGEGLATVAGSLAILLGFTLVFLVLGLKLFKWEE